MKDKGPKKKETKKKKAEVNSAGSPLTAPVKKVKKTY